MNRESTTFPVHVSLESIAEETGKNLRQWIKVLSEHSNSGKSQAACAQFLIKEFGLTYEWAEYLSKRHFNDLEKSPIEASYASATKTFPLAIHVVESYFTEDILRDSWLDNQFVIIGVNPGKNLKLQGSDRGTVQVNFNGKGIEKCQVTIQQFNLKSDEEAIEMKKFWKNKLSLLSKLFKLHD